MSVGLWILCGLIAVPAVIAVCVVLWKHGSPLRRLLGSAVQGLCALAAVNVAGTFTGVSLGLGWFSGTLCALLGIPGVLLLLLLKAVFSL